MVVKKPVLPLILIVGIIAAVIGILVLRHGPDSNVIKLSGNIELTQVNVAFKSSGLITELLTDEGKNVKKGDVIARIDGEQLMRTRDRESAAESVATAVLGQAEAATQWQKQTFSAELAARKAELAGAEARLKELETGSRSEEVEEARAAVTAAAAENEHAQNDWERAQRLFKQDDISAQQHDQSRARAQSSAAALRQAQQRLALLQAGPRKEVIDAQREQVRRARADVAAAEATTFEIRRRELEITAKRADLDRARAQVSLTDTQINETVATSPVDGVVLVKTADVGEVVAGGTTIVTIGDIDRPWLRGYVPETELGRVKVGQPVRVTTDSYRGKVYNGKITFIASQAEFTPKQIQTAEERVKMVYRIKIDVENPNRELKLNMPADAEILLQSQ
jgi:HlyD family secretion protein